MVRVFSDMFPPRVILASMMVFLQACAVQRPTVEAIARPVGVSPSDNLTANDWVNYRGTDGTRLISRNVCGANQRKTAFFVTFSGGGSRAAYFAANVLHELDQFGPEPLTGKIDGIFSVSGGSLAAALYAVSYDQISAPAKSVIWSRDLTDQVLPKNLIGSMAREVATLVGVPGYLFGDISRTDLLEAAIEREVLLSSGGPLRYRDINPKRPPIFINATVATSEGAAAFAPHPFGSVFIFSQPDLIKIGIEPGSVPIARAVAASAAFPGLLTPVALPRFRQSAYERQLGMPRFLHLMDGGNADNLGLLGVKRVLLEDQHRLLRECDSVVVLTVDAFGRQGRHEDSRPTRPSPTGWFFDYNSALASFDALLAANRARLLGEFKSRVLMPPGSEELCLKDGLPDEVCGGGVRADWNEINQLVKRKLFFAHLNFQSPEVVKQTSLTHCKGAYGSANPDCEVMPVDGARLGCEIRSLRSRLESIPTTFGLSEAEREDIKIFVALNNQPKNICFQHLFGLVTNKVKHSESFYQEASASCDETTSLRGGDVPSGKHIRGRIFGDVILKDGEKPFTPFSDYCKRFDAEPPEERIRFLEETKVRLLASPKHMTN